MNWHAVLAIARKDMLDALKNQWLLIGLITPIAMSLIFRVVFPGVDESEKLKVVIHDPGNSRLAAALRQSPEVELVEVALEAQLAAEVEEGAVGGLVVPTGFDAAVDGGERPELTVYRNVRAGFELIAFRRLVETQVWSLTGQELPARLDFVDVPEWLIGQSSEEFQIDVYVLTLMMVLGLGMTGSVIVPTLLVEEREKHTLQVLLTSPAGPAEVALAKALTGMVYSLLIAGVLILMNRGWEGDWPITLLSVALGSLFMVAVGLLMGMLCHTTTQVNTWATVVLLAMMIPVMFVGVTRPPAVLETATQFIPTYYLADALNRSLSGHASLTRVGVDLAALSGCALVILAVVISRLRRREV